MGLRSNFITSDKYCISHTNFNPTSAAEDVATDFDVDVNVTTGGTISTVSFTPGDGGPAVNMTLDSGVTYTTSHTYADPGQYVARIVTTLTTGETQEDLFVVTIT